MQETLAKDCDWTPETVRRFWEYFGTRTDLHYQYFSYQVGSGLANFLESTGRLRPDTLVLDYGCGQGFLVEKLLARGACCYGIDSSAKAVEHVNIKLNRANNWKGASVINSTLAPFSDSYFDLVTCLETLEHLLDNQLPIVLKDIYRLLKPGGVAFFTTPNEENLSHNYIFCPFCQTQFHNVQHVRSFTKESLHKLMASSGFKVLFCESLDFMNFQKQFQLSGWKDISLRVIYNWLVNRKNIYLDRLMPRPFPNSRDFIARATAGPQLCALVERDS